MTRLNDVRQIAIVGTGLLGASIGLALKQRGYGGRIVGVSRRLETAQRACELGAIDQAFADPAAVVAETQLLIVAVPLGAFAQVFRQIAPHDHDQLVMTDVGSTKLNVLADAYRYLPVPQRFVGAHPMAGSEKQGPEGARAELFENKPCIITAEADTDATALRQVETLWQWLGMKLLRMSPTDHDAHTAVVSHLPHAAAVMLIQTAADMGGWDVASTGFRDTTRLASSNPPMRVDIMLANREKLIDAIDTFTASMNELKNILNRNDREALLKTLEAARSMREDWLSGEK